MKKPTKLLFCTDIYGLTPVKKAHYQQAFDLEIEFVSPYMGLDQQDLTPSYEVFTKQVGMNKYTKMVTQAIKNLDEQPFVAIGESVGATALWCNTPQLKPNQCLGVICLYGSRIRDQLAIQPQCDTQLIFSKDEGYFVTAAVKNQLNHKAKVNCEVSPLPHGFATPGHEFFDQAVFSQLFSGLCSGH